MIKRISIIRRRKGEEDVGMTSLVEVAAPVITGINRKNRQADHYQTQGFGIDPDLNQQQPGFHFSTNPNVEVLR